MKSSLLAFLSYCPPRQCFQPIVAETLPSACRESMTVSPVRFFSHTRQSMGNWKEAPGPETVLYFVCGLFASKGETPSLWAQLEVKTHRLMRSAFGTSFQLVETALILPFFGKLKVVCSHSCHITPSAMFSANCGRDVAIGMPGKHDRFTSSFFSHTRQSMGNWKEAPGPETVLYFVCGMFASKGEKPFLWAQLAVLVPQADEKCLRHRLPAGRNGINFTIFGKPKVVCSHSCHITPQFDPP